VGMVILTVINTIWHWPI